MPTGGNITPVPDPQAVHFEPPHDHNRKIGVWEKVKGLVMYCCAALLQPLVHIWSVYLHRCSQASLARFERFSKVDDLNNAITFLYKLLDLRSPGHPDRSASLSNLGSAIRTRFDQTGRIQDLEEAITFHHQSLELCPPGHPYRFALLNNLGIAIQKRFDQTGRIEDLEEAITSHHQSLELCPPEHPDRSALLNNLGSTIRTRFDQTGRIQDLEEAITFLRQSLNLRPPGHPDRSTSLNNLGNAIRIRFDQAGRIEDLEEAIAFHRKSLDLRPPGHPDRSASLNNLGSAIRTRFDQTGRIEDLEEAIIFHHQSLDLRPPGHPNRTASLGNLGNAIRTRFDQTGRIEDLEEAITFLRQSLDIRPLGHPDRFASLNNLGIAIKTRFDQMGRIQDLEEAITFHRQSLDLCPPGHPNRSASLNSLGDAIQTRFDKTGRIEDLHESAMLLSDAETTLPAEHPERSIVRLRLAHNHLKQHTTNPTGHHLSTAFTLFDKSSTHHTASVKARFAATRQWVSAAIYYQHESVVRAYSISLTLLNRYLNATSSVELQHKFLTTIPKSFASDAASAAIEAGQVETAVVFLEQGRAMLWSELRGLRPPLEELRTVNPELADQFESLSGQLERYAMSFESASMVSQVELGRGFQRRQVPFEVKQQRYRILSEEQAKVVERIQKIEGFASFLNPVPFNALQMAAIEGPVIIINISRRHSDAIIVRHIAPPVHVHLPDAWSSDLSLLSSKLLDPAASKAEAFPTTVLSMLRSLWKMIVHPVIDHLAELGVAERTRIWWCPTSDLCALPLHATGPYLPGQKSLPDLYISSYTATLSALIAARSGVARHIATPNILVVGDIGQPDAPIPSVKDEIHQIWSLGNFVNVLFGENANRDTVLAHLPQYHWIHLACHGHRNAEPFHSFFQLHSGQRLELLDLMKARLPIAEFAFLSACNAAAADTRGAPDEVIHLASGMQFCGFRSVVGTLWAMADIDGPDVARDFYGYMFRNRENIVDFKDSAKALNIATRKMRMRNVPLSQWVNFVHIGA